MPSGEICSLVVEKGFGFIKPKAGGSDVFFHNSVVNCPLDSLRIGQEVDYEIDPTAEKTRAKSVAVSGVPGATVKRQPDRRQMRNHSSAPSRSTPVVKPEFGYVTKVLWKRRQGFISADAGGAELLFNESDVSGEKKYQQLKVGDYVRFVRDDSSGIWNPIHEPPTVKSVEAIDRIPKKLPNLELPNHPKRRGKKPTWR